METVDWPEIALLVLAALALPVNILTLWRAGWDRWAIHRDGRNGVLELLSDRDLREAGQRVLSCLALLLVAWSLVVLPRNPGPSSWPRWTIQASLVVMAVSMLMVGLHNSLDAGEISRRLRRAKIKED